MSSSELRRVKEMPESIWRLEDVPGARAEIPLAELKKILEAERREQISLNGLNSEAMHANSVIEGAWRVITGLDDPIEDGKEETPNV